METKVCHNTGVCMKAKHENNYWLQKYVDGMMKITFDLSQSRAEVDQQYNIALVVMSERHNHW